MPIFYKGPRRRYGWSTSRASCNAGVPARRAANVPGGGSLSQRPGAQWLLDIQLSSATAWPVLSASFKSDAGTKGPGVGS
jgi:hypothetical protein